MYVLSDHAIKRAKQRLKLSKAALSRMLPIALENGMRAGDTSGSLRRYVDKLGMHSKSCTVHIYGENVFIMGGNVLVTVYQVPNKLKSKVAAARRKR